jgi:PST family polysaccharide transporter
VGWPAVLISAKLLAPGDFGLTEMAGFYFVVTNVMAEFGIGMAVLQLRELDMEITAQLNTVAAVSGFLAFLLSVAAAPMIAAFFHARQLRYLVVVASLSFILTSVEAIPLGLLQRDTNYRRFSFAESIQALITSFVSVACAHRGLGYSALVVGNIVGISFMLSTAVRRGSRGRDSAGWWLRYAFGMEIAVQRVVGGITGLSEW